MSEINVQLKNGGAAQLPGPVTVADALKRLDRDVAKQALAARVNGQEVDLAFTLGEPQNGAPFQIEPVLPETPEGLDVLRHSTAHLLAKGRLGESAEWRIVPVGSLGLGTYFTGAGLGMYGEAGWNLVEAVGGTALREG